MAGGVYRPKYTDKQTGKRKQQDVWWIYYSINGRKQRESAKTTKKKEAEAFLARRLASIQPGGPAPSTLQRVRFEELAELVREDYKRNGRKSLARLEQSINALSTVFEGAPVPAINEAAIERYVGKRLKAGRAPATVNRELAALKRMLRLGYRQQRVGRVPHIAMLEERNVRKGFLRRADLWALREVLDPCLVPLVNAAYITGWRRSELLSRNWDHVDFLEGWLHLWPGETKSGRGRAFPFTEELREVLERQRGRRGKMGLGTGPGDPVFYRYDGRNRGGRIVSFNKEWKRAVKAAGLPELRFHDLRRSAIMWMVAAGIPEGTAQELSGHKTRAVFDRYNIQDQAALRRAAKQLEDAPRKAAKALNKQARAERKGQGSVKVDEERGNANLQ